MTDAALNHHRFIEPLTVARLAAVIILALASTAGHRVLAQQPPSGGEDIVELNLAGAVSLPRLVEAVSQQLDVRFLYSADLANRQVTVYTPARLPRSALPILLGSLLKGENLAVVESNVPGWKRIVDIKDMVPYATPGKADAILARDGPAAVVTQVIPVRNANISQLTQTLRPFLSQGASFITLSENQLVIVTDYAQNVKTMAELLKLIDEPTGQAVIEFYETRNRTPAALIEQVEALVSAGEDPGGTPPASAAANARLFNDASGKRVVVAGERDRVQRILGLLQQLDTGMDFQTRAYRLQNVSASRIDNLVRGLVSSDESEQVIETTIDEDGNLLIVRAPAEIHRQVKTLIEQLDRPVDTSESPIQFYKLRNANAIEVLYSLLALQQAAGSEQVVQAGASMPGAFGTLGGLDPRAVGLGLQNLGAAGVFGDTGGQNLRMPFESGNATDTARSSSLQNQNRSLEPLIGGGGASVASAGGLGLGGLGYSGLGYSGLGYGGLGYGGLGYGGLAGGLGAGQVATLPGGARVSADVATNSLIVYAPANIQPLYERLIRSLDQRRPQVMIEAEIVAVDTTDNFELGVEVSIGDRTGSKKLFKFTSFGLSEVDGTNGMLTPIPNLGFNGILLDPEVADVIVQALSTHSRGRVLASPKILVNDNQTGTLESVNSVPFNSVNTVNTISTQSLGGDQQAGTTITVTPHINEDDHLQLEFEVEFSAFVGEGITIDGGIGGADVVLPPARQIDRVGSVVTIPDGKTIVVGGLKQITDSHTFAGVPWVEHIPLLRELTSRTNDTHQTTSFFLFIRPKILRDSRFRDLRYLSDIDVDAAQIEGDYPKSHPIVIPCLNPPTPTGRPLRHPPGQP
jgi:general secretion pathway protein D